MSRIVSWSSCVSQRNFKQFLWINEIDKKKMGFVFACLWSFRVVFYTVRKHNVMMWCLWLSWEREGGGHPKLQRHRINSSPQCKSSVVGMKRIPFVEKKIEISCDFHAFYRSFEQTDKVWMINNSGRGPAFFREGCVCVINRYNRFLVFHGYFIDKIKHQLSRGGGSM